MISEEQNANNNEKNFAFLGKHIIKGKITLKTGLHIGGTDEGFKIGGVDNIIIRDPLTDKPIIPGSSLKGKIRSLLEWKYAKISMERDKKNNIIGKVIGKDVKSNFILRLFGQTKDWKVEKDCAIGPVRLIFRDAFLNTDQGEEYNFVEVKAENSIDRLTSRANPRFMERVLAGTEFDFEIVMDNYLPEDYEDLKYVFEGLSLLEDSFLGGGGSRGSGFVEIIIDEILKRSKDYYSSSEKEVALKLGKSPHEIVIKFDNELKKAFKFNDNKEEN